MKFFLDTANLEAIIKHKETGLINGVTTNPTHLSKETGNIIDLIKKICEVMDPDPVSVEVTQKTAKDVYEQAKRVAALAPNVVVKIPCHKDYLQVINKLVQEKVPLNITLVFSAVQALAMAKLQVNYISPFIGRIDDIDYDGMQLIYDIRQILDNYNFKSKLLAASLRNVRHVHEVALAGADVATIPVEVMDKMLNHPLTDLGIKKFDEDWQKLAIKQFPH